MSPQSGAISPQAVIKCRCDADVVHESQKKNQPLDIITRNTSKDKTSPISSAFSDQITSFSSWKPIYTGLNNRCNLNKTTTGTTFNFVDNEDILFYSKKTSFKKVRIVTAGDLGVFVNDTEAGSEDTDQGSRSLFFFPPCTLKVKKQIFPHWKSHLRAPL